MFPVKLAMHFSHDNVQVYPYTLVLLAKNDSKADNIFPDASVSKWRKLVFASCYCYVSEIYEVRCVFTLVVETTYNIAA